jgi:hypothetical protein
MLELDMIPDFKLIQAAGMYLQDIPGRLAGSIIGTKHQAAQAA